MRYKGEKAPVRMGMGGLLTDLSPNDIPDTHLREATNVSLRNNDLQKDFGVRRWNRTAQGSGIVALREWFPTDAKAYAYTINKGGSVFRYENRETSTQITAASASDPASLVVSGSNAFIVPGGEESPGNAKKLFVFTRNNQIQVIVGTGITYRNITTPSADFAASNYPRFGIVHRNRLWVFLDHRAYASDPDNHEDLAGGIQFGVYPGTGDFIQTAFIYKKALFVVKKGGGVFQLIDTDTSTTNWYFTQVSDQFGIAAHDAVIEPVGGDLLLMNDEGTITSLKAVQEFGDIESGDIFKVLGVKNQVLQDASVEDLSARRAIYDRERKIGYFTYKPQAKAAINAIWKIDFSGPRPELTISDKEQANCLAFMELPTGKKKLFYGSNDGYIYETEVEQREIGKVFNPTACDAALGSGAGSLDNATYVFTYYFEDASGNVSLIAGPTAQVTVADKSVNGKIEITNIDVDSTGSATKRVILGRKTTDTAWTEIAEIADNVTTVYTVNSDPSDWTAVTLPTANTFNEAYTMRALSPNLNFSHVNPAYAGIQKHFDFVEVAFLPTGRWDTSLEYWIDGIYKRERTFKVSKGPILDDFLLNTDRIDAESPRYAHFKLHGTGRNFAFALEQSGLMENCKITAINVYFRIGNEDRKAVLSGRKAR